MTKDNLYKDLKLKLEKIVPDFELKIKADIAFEILKLKQERNAVILGHNYMEPALFHSIPDYVGDSLELSKIASKTNKDIIVFCGVRFMAETAKILSPSKTVLIPSSKAGCSLADGITANDVRKLKNMFPGIPVITYINTNADVKAETDICCTSSNAAAVVNSFKNQPIIFLPDEYLAKNVAQTTGRKIIFPNINNDAEKYYIDNNTIIGWHARCEVHEQFTVQDIENMRQQFEGVNILSHPECSPEVVNASDFSGSTTEMVKHIQKTNSKSYLLLTECSMGDNIMAVNPNKNILRLCSIRCPHMNEITLEDTLTALQKTQYVVEVPEEIRLRAFSSVNKMLSINPSAMD